MGTYADVEKTIGTGKDYSTIQGWADQINEDEISGQSIAGLLENETFDENDVDIIEGTNATFVLLRPNTGNNHNGIAGSGAELQGHLTANSSVEVRVEYLDVNPNEEYLQSAAVDGSSQVDFRIRGCIIHSHDWGYTTLGIDAFHDSGTKYVVDNIVYDIKGTGNYDAIGARGYQYSGGTFYIDNNTIYNVNNTHSTGNAYGFWDYDTYVGTNKKFYRGNAVAGTSVSGTGTARDYWGNGDTYTNAVGGDHSDEDGTAGSDGSHSTQTITPSDEWQNVASRDFRLKSGANLIDFSEDLGDVYGKLDCIEYDRHAGGGAWDGGAHEYVSAVGDAMPMAMNHYRRMRI